MLIERPPGLLKKAFPKMIWKIPEAADSLFLTFDDGPTPGITEEVLSVLQDFNVCATFFCLGKNVDKYPDLYTRMLAEGHLTGNHTYSHLNGWKTKTENYIKDISLAGEIVHSNLFRPPYGKIKPKQSSRIRKDYHIIFWDVLSRDYDVNISGEDCYHNVMHYARGGSIIVFHDSLKAGKRMLYALPRVLEELSSKNYSFKPLEIDG